MATKAVFTSGSTLWVTDGTVAGTQQLESGNSVRGNNIAGYGNLALFNMFNGSFVEQLFATDGTVAGTTQLSSASSGYDFSFAAGSATTIGSKAILATNFAEDLVVTNGTPAGTTVLTPPTIPGVNTWIIGSDLYSLGNKVIFAAPNTHSNYNAVVTDLWVTDGTSAGTTAIVPSGAPLSGIDPQDFHIFGNKAAFTGTDGSNEQGVWVTDGTAAGTTEILPGEWSSPNSFTLPGSMLALGTKLLFEAGDANLNRSLWITDGTASGTTELTVSLPDLDSSASITNNTELGPILQVALGTKALFVGWDANMNYQLWVTDGTSGGTSEISPSNLDINGMASVYANYQLFFTYGNKVLFEAEDTLGKYGLWVADGTAAGTHELAPSNADFYGLLSGAVTTPDFALTANGVVFNGTNASGQQGLWVTDGTSAGTHEISVQSGSSTLSPTIGAITSIDLPVPPSISVPCFAAGTRIATERGEVAVEDLRAGDRLRVLLGDELAPVIWIGHREANCARHPRPRQVWPVRVLAGAFGPGLPHRDLLLSPDHAVYANEVLIPVKHLINGSTIVQVPMDSVTYYHVELPCHDVILAEGLPAESYLDVDDRGNFDNGGAVVRMHPDFASRVWEAEGCAELVVTGPEFDAVRQMLAMLAAAEIQATECRGRVSTTRDRKPPNSVKKGRRQ